jgi:nicotinate-nucleotide pyrophosphorylase (carboxylating)
MELLSVIELDKAIERALAEDIGHGDITTRATVEHGVHGNARIIVKEPEIVFAGGFIMERVFHMTGSDPHVVKLAEEGARLRARSVAGEFEGQLAGLLIGERVALNFVQLLTGIATLTRKFVDAVEGTTARIVDTRKTHPGLRALEKYAVRAGGGNNHRFGLDSGILIKDNHIAAAGSISRAIDRVKRSAPHTSLIEVECETLAQLDEARNAGAHIILLDNMAIDDIRQARKQVGPNIKLEVSGNVSLDTVRPIAEAGVDLISVGALTHSARAADLSMKIEST